MPGRRSPRGHSVCNPAVTPRAIEPTTMTHDTVLTAQGLGKRYRRRWALADCTLTIPAGRVVGLVGPNGAGKTTLLRLAVGMLAPTEGTIDVLGGPPAANPAQLGRVGFVAQDTPTYANLTVGDHLRLGRWMNTRWDRGLAERRVAQLGLDPRQRAGRLSGGQRAQLALTLAIAKRPELLVLDEPVASLDPLARREFLQGISDVAAENGVSVILSSHLVGDVERVCDFVIVLVASRVRVAGSIQDLLATHHRVIGPPDGVVTGGQVIEPAASGEPASLEDIVLAYMGAEAQS
jgi:ABC-2 type transport system ATP-binding protein